MKIGLLFICAIGIYIFFLVAQTRVTVNLCDSYPAGSQIEDIDSLKGTFLLTQMGPLEDHSRPGTYEVIFCANMTMCDTSCRFEVENQVVKRAIYSAI